MTTATSAAPAPPSRGAPHLPVVPFHSGGRVQAVLPGDGEGPGEPACPGRLHRGTGAPLIRRLAHRRPDHGATAAPLHRERRGLEVEADRWRDRGVWRVPCEPVRADREALQRCQAVLTGGEPLVMFPEGTRRSGTEGQELKDGVAYLALRAGCPVVPVGIGGSECAMPRRVQVSSPATGERRDRACGPGPESRRCALGRPRQRPLGPTQSQGASASDVRRPRHSVCVRATYKEAFDEAEASLRRSEPGLSAKSGPARSLAARRPDNPGACELPGVVEHG